MGDSNEVDLLRRQTLMMAARIGALETTTRILFALICSYDGSPQMLDKLKGGIFPLMLEEAKKKLYPGTRRNLPRGWWSKRCKF